MQERRWGSTERVYRGLARVLSKPDLEKGGLPLERVFELENN
jgi:hypothetical protein